MDFVPWLVNEYEHDPSDVVESKLPVHIVMSFAPSIILIEKVPDGRRVSSVFALTLTVKATA